MNTKDKKKEKPSFLSKRVVKTQLRNEWENIRLDEELRQLNREKFNKNYKFIKTAQELHTRMSQIKQVKTSLSVSPERRLFVRKHGFAIDVKEFDIDYFMDLVFDRTGSSEPKTTTSTPLIRVNDFIHDKEKKEQERAVIEDDVVLEAVDEVPKRPESSRTPLHNAPTKKIRVIQPPLKGREIWKVHMERDRQEKEGVINKDHDEDKEDLDEKVEAYRKKIVRKVEQSSSNTAYRPHTSTSTNRQVDRGKLLTSKFERKAVSARARLGNNNSSNNNTCTNKTSDKQPNDQLINLAKQLPTLLIASPPANHESPLQRKSSRALSLDRLRVPSSSSSALLRERARSAGANEKRRGSYSRMQIHVNGKTASLFVSKLK